jgi:hypothetical protein
MAAAVGTRRRFLLAFVALGAVLGGAIGTFVLLVERPAPPPRPPWSAWRPNASALSDRAREIASHVGREYRLPSGHRLVQVVVGVPGTTQLPIRAIALSAIPQPKTANDFRIYDPRKSVMYVLCGAGSKCAIAEGKPTVQRGAVLRREALELALYTFRYLGGRDSVVVFFPPRKGQKLSFVLFFQRQDFGSELKHPLRRTLPTRKRILPLPGAISAAERARVDGLTGSRVFRFELDRARSGGSILVLAPPAS